MTGYCGRSQFPCTSASSQAVYVDFVRARITNAQIEQGAMYGQQFSLPCCVLCCATCTPTSFPGVTCFAIRNRSHEDTEAPAHAGDTSRGDRTLGSSSNTVEKGRRAGARDSVEGGCGNPESTETSADECEL